MVSDNIEIEKSVNYLKRKVRFDVVAKDNKGRIFNVEIQNDSRGASPERMAYHLAALTVDSLETGQDFSELPSIVSIFITRRDTLNEGKPLSIFSLFNEDDYTSTKNTSQIKGIYVNGADQDLTTKLGKLMHDFSMTNPDEMLTPTIKERSRFYKENEEGIRKMEGLFKDFFEKTEREAEKRGEKRGEKKKSIDVALYLLKEGTLPLEKISEASGLTIKQIENLRSEPVF